MRETLRYLRSVYQSPAFKNKALKMSMHTLIIVSLYQLFNLQKPTPKFGEKSVETDEGEP